MALWQTGGGGGGGGGVSELLPGTLIQDTGYSDETTLVSSTTLSLPVGTYSAFRIRGVYVPMVGGSSKRFNLLTGGAQPGTNTAEYRRSYTQVNQVAEQVNLVATGNTIEYAIETQIGKGTLDPNPNVYLDIYLTRLWDFDSLAFYRWIANGYSMCRSTGNYGSPRITDTTWRLFCSTDQGSPPDSINIQHGNAVKLRWIVEGYERRI